MPGKGDEKTPGVNFQNERRKGCDEQFLFGDFSERMNIFETVEHYLTPGHTGRIRDHKRKINNYIRRRERQGQNKLGSPYLGPLALNKTPTWKRGNTGKYLQIKHVLCGKGGQEVSG